MKIQRSGFTLVELLLAVLISTVLITGAYQALLAQNRSYRATDAMVQGQDALRIGLGVLESELQEVASIGGSGPTGIGGTDILMASPDSIRIRAPRKLGFVCSVSPSDLMMTIWTRGELFEAPDKLLIFVDGVISTSGDDNWQTAVVANVTSSSETCVTSPTGEADQKVILASFGLTGVSTGAPIRGYEEIAYGLYEFDGEWGLGRRDSDGSLSLLVGGLAGPEEGGLRLQYYDPAGAVTTNRDNVQTIEINLRTAPRPGSGTEPMDVTSSIHLRNH